MWIGKANASRNVSGVSPQRKKRRNGSGCFSYKTRLTLIWVLKPLRNCISMMWKTVWKKTLGWQRSISFARRYFLISASWKSARFPQRRLSLGRMKCLPTVTKRKSRTHKPIWKRCTISCQLSSTTLYDIMNCVPILPQRWEIWGVRNTRKCCFGQRKNTRNFPMKWWINLFPFTLLKCSTGAVFVRANY